NGRVRDRQHARQPRDHRRTAGADERERVSDAAARLQAAQYQAGPRRQGEGRRSRRAGADGDARSRSAVASLHRCGNLSPHQVGGHRQRARGRRRRRADDRVFGLSRRRRGESPVRPEGVVCRSELHDHGHECAAQRQGRRGAVLETGGEISKGSLTDSFVRRAALAGFIGTALETYDFFLYGTAAALVLNHLYFPNLGPLAGLLASLGTYSVGFVARPVGGIVIGHFGDRNGRRSMLVLTLVTMGTATVAIGLLPPYDRIGVWPPVLLVLLRLAQGFAVGGEWSGAALMAVEHADPARRGFYGSWTQIGT